MAISKETQEWLDDLKKEGTLSEEVIQNLKTAVEANSKADGFLKGSVLRQSDYSRRSAEVDTAKKTVEDSQAALKQREEAVTKFQAELGTWKQGAEENYNKALKEREAAEKKASAAQARLRTLAIANGLSEEEVLKDLDVSVIPEKKIEPTFDTSKFLTREDVEKATREATLLDAVISDLKDEHRALFGSGFNATALVQEAIASKRGIRDLWEERFKVKDKQAEVAEGVIQKRINDAVAAKDAELRSTMQLPSPRPNDPLSPLFRPDGLPKPKVDDDGPGGVSAAIAAFNTGKYRIQIPGR